MKVYIDCNDKKQRKEMVDYVHSKISAAEKFGRCSSVIRLGWMKKIEAVMERQEEIIEEQEERIAIMSESGENKLNHHEVACIIADLFCDPCACNFNGNDEWLPQHCDFADTCCPNPVGVACWEQYLKYLDKKPPKEGEQ